MEERAFTRACFAGIEDRLLPEKRLRPPLAADKVSERTPSAPGPSTAPAQRESKGKGKGKGKKTTPAAPTAQTVPQDLPREDPLLPSTTPSNQPWVKVVSKKRKGKKKVAPKPPAAKPAAAAEKRKKLPSSEIRSRSGGTKADLFASKLREAVADTAKVVRPVKCVALEVTDLDDSVTQEEVVAAVAAVGGCAVELVKGRTIRPGRGGPSQGQPKGPSQGQPKSRDASASETSRAPSAASLLRGGDMVSDLSDTESNMSGSNCGSTRQSRKRAFLRRDSRGSPDQMEKPAKRAVIQADLEERIFQRTADPNHQSQGWLRRLQRPLRGPFRRGNGAHGSGGSAGDSGGGLQVLQFEGDLPEGPEMPGSELARHRKGVGAAHHLRRNAATAGESGSPAKRGVGAARTRCRAHGPA
ncbi:hypothetical protein HF086_008976 [Spodoptera exigua]|uniref:Gag-like protein n=1 Tax=Spodoptera exigua TaxID=7107 RepID=A0A922MUH2_SPOEX|nr:hypothetical protein HF086_008976 [Spodoptera exigua]